MTTIQLIKEHGDTSKITIRDIASKSNVGVGLINYHFQTKEKLIDICILRIINQFIEEIEELYQNLEMSPLEKLKYVLKVKANYIIENSGISKISMLLDLNSSEIGDNTDHAATVHFKVLKEAFSDRKTDSELFVLLHIIMSSIQVAFLRSEVFKLRTNIDFHDAIQRERFIDTLVDNLCIVH